MVKSKKSHAPTTFKKSKRFSRLMLLLVIIAVAILIISVVLLAVIPRHPHCPSLAGSSWLYSGPTEYEGDFIYTFKTDGTGSYQTPDGTYNFVYIDDEETFSLLYSGNTEYGVYPYTISDDETTLTILDSNNEPVEYTCNN